MVQSLQTKISFMPSNLKLSISAVSVRFELNFGEKKNKQKFINKSKF
jgi:hypothetical protein